MGAVIRLLNVPVPRCLVASALGRRDDRKFMDTYVSKTHPTKEMTK